MVNYLNNALKKYASNYNDLPAQCWRSIILSALNTLSIGVCFFLSLYFVTVLHISIQTTGIIIACYGLGTVIGGFAGGKLSDAFSPKMVSIASLFIQTLSFLCLIKVTSPYWLMLTMLISGVASYGFKTSNNVFILQQCGEHSDIRLRTVGIMHMANNLGLGLSGILIGELSSYGFHYIFWLSGILLFSSAIYLLLSSDQSLFSTHTEIAPEIKKETAYQANPLILKLTLTCLFLMGLIFAQLSTTYSIYVQDAFPELGIKAVSILFILDTILIVLFQAPIIALIKPYRKVLILGLGAFLLGLGMLILSFSFTFTLALISCLVWTIGEMLFMPPAQLLCYENAPATKKGQTLGVFQSTYATSCVAGPAIGGFIYQHLGGNTLWYISAALGLACLVACIKYRNQ